MDKISAPVVPGDVVGKIEFYNANNEKIREEDLTIKETIKKASYWDLFKRNLKEIFSGKNIV